MLQPSEGSDRERILAMGPPGAGKSTAWLQVARWAQQTKSPAKFYVMDTDAAIRRMLHGERYKHLTNVVLTDVFEWREYTKTLDDYLGKATSDDWIVADFIGSSWDAVQEWYIGEIYRQDIDQFFMDARKNMRSGNPLDGWKDWCVDSATEILTYTGWKTYDQLRIGEQVLTFTEYGSTWQPVLDIYIGEDKSRRKLILDGKSHSSVTTADHRWLVEVQRRNKHGYNYTWEWRTSETLDVACRISHAVPRLDLPQEAKYQDALVELVAWYWMEGWKTKQRGTRPSMQGGISQSVKHPEYVRRIRSAIRVLGLYAPEYLKDNDVLYWRLNTAEMELMESVAPDKLPSWEFLHSLTAAQIKLFVETCVDADGTRRKSSKQVVWTQVSLESTDRFEWACAQAGIPTRTSPERQEGFSSGIRQHVELLSSGGVWPVMAARLKTGMASADWVEESGIVWCPTTASGTWLARRDGKVFFTGNSVINRTHKAFMNNLIHRNPAHTYLTAVAEPLRDTDDKAIKATFGAFGVKPKGQKHLGYQVHTILLMQTMRPGEWYMSTVKDRERPQHEGTKLNDFVIDYLAKTALWRL